MENYDSRKQDVYLSELIFEQNNIQFNLLNQERGLCNKICQLSGSLGRQESLAQGQVMIQHTVRILHCKIPCHTGHKHSSGHCLHWELDTRNSALWLWKVLHEKWIPCGVHFLILLVDEYVLFKLVEPRSQTCIHV